MPYVSSLSLRLVTSVVSQITDPYPYPALCLKYLERIFYDKVINSIFDCISTSQFGFFK